MAIEVITHLKAGLIDHDDPGAEQVLIRTEDDYPLTILHIDMFYGATEAYNDLMAGEILILKVVDTGNRESKPEPTAGTGS